MDRAGYPDRSGRTPAAAASALPDDGRPWRMAAAWLLFLGPFFFATYNAANWLASQRAQVPSLVFEWERALPFVPWTIVPYWTIDAFYAVSLFLCRDRAEVGTLGRRLLTAQVIAVLCFIVFPLRFAFTQPAADGVFGAMFIALSAFDKPFNQAPSLHIALLVILWVHYAPRCAGMLRLALHGWFALIGVSVLTTFQHHFIDIPSGAALGLFCLWLWPADPALSPLGAARRPDDPAARRLALRYGLGALACLAAALALHGAALWLLWGTISLGLVSAAYAGLGPVVFQKDGQGRLSVAALGLLAPYLLGARINVWAWTRGQAPAVEIADGVWLGRYPTPAILARLPVRGIVDVSAEMTGRLACPGKPASPGLPIRAVPGLDLLAPAGPALHRAAGLIEQARAGGPVLVCCALGYSRSAAAIAVWLVYTGRSADMAAAIERIRRLRPAIVLDAGRLEAAALTPAAARS